MQLTRKYLLLEMLLAGVNKAANPGEHWYWLDESQRAAITKTVDVSVFVWRRFSLCVSKYVEVLSVFELLKYAVMFLDGVSRICGFELQHIYWHPTQGFKSTLLLPQCVCSSLQWHCLWEKQESKKNCGIIQEKCNFGSSSGQQCHF